jgi:hypothetical protein
VELFHGTQASHWMNQSSSDMLVATEPTKNHFIHDDKQPCFRFIQNFVILMVPAVCGKSVEISN